MSLRKSDVRRQRSRLSNKSTIKLFALPSIAKLQIFQFPPKKSGRVYFWVVVRLVVCPIFNSSDVTLAFEDAQVIHLCIWRRLTIQMIQKLQMIQMIQVIQMIKKVQKVQHTLGYFWGYFINSCGILYGYFWDTLWILLAFFL